MNISMTVRAMLHRLSLWATAVVLVGTLGCATGNPGNGNDTCGNLTLDDGEECDDGNTVSEDGCSDTCQIEVCGDGVTQTGLGEECDDGNNTDGDGCSATCQVETSPDCGNGVTEGSEECDDGNNTDGDGCSATCQVETPPNCGNGVTEGSEECDDGNTVSEDGCSATCLLETCGDGIVQPGLNEECDDSNTVSEDGCSATCLLETCGDGIVQPGLNEECDDGNTTDGDGCSATCQLDTLILQPGSADGKDADVYDLNPDTNNGDATYSFAQAWTWSSTPGLRRCYFEFPLPAALLGCTVSSATLYLYHNPLYLHEGLNGNTLETEIARATQAWDEHQITWNNQPPVNAASTLTVPPPPASDSDIQVDLTAIVSHWFANPGSNFGIRLKLQTEVHYRLVSWTSSDYVDDPLRRPALAVDFSSCP